MKHRTTVICPPPAHKVHQVEGLAAPAMVGGSGEGTSFDFVGVNRSAWMSIADFLTLENLRAVLAQRAACAAHGKRSAGAALAVAGLSALPDGNHGDNLTATVGTVCNVGVLQ